MTTVPTERHDVRTEPNRRRVRVFFGGEQVADSTDTLYLFETGHPPVYYFPRSDVRDDLLRSSETTSHCPYKGDASYWSVVAGDRVADDAVWAYPAPPPGCPDISGHVAFYWDRMDAWYEEDQEVFVHPRDPYHRVDAIPSSRHVRVSFGGDTLGESDRPVLLFETHLPTRHYLPRPDVRMDLLRPAETRTRCPYKGEAIYFDVEAGGVRLADAAWSYPAPIPEIPKIEQLICFFDERVDVEVDGMLQSRPHTRWV